MTPGELPTNQLSLSQMQRSLNKTVLTRKSSPFLNSIKSSQMKQAKFQQSAAHRQRRRAARESITSCCWQYPNVAYHALADADVAIELADVDMDVQQEIWDTYAAEEKREDEQTSFPFPCVVVPEKKAKRRGKGKGKERAVLTDGEAFEMIGDDVLVMVQEEGVWDEDEWEIVRGDDERSEGRRTRPTYSAIVKGGGAHAGG
ncbi:hypothetical protein DENSPDRAFT_873487 [Dentipellis sp. KUC8613]|nr:hypothetical protein DENSPDRAFT_873487 [Dentipellis sp. KUC8613]